MIKKKERKNENVKKKEKSKRSTKIGKEYKHKWKKKFKKKRDEIKKERGRNGNVLQINEHTKSGENKQRKYKWMKKKLLFFDPCEKNTFHFSLAIYFKGDPFLSPPSTKNSNGVERVESINTWGANI